MGRDQSNPKDTGPAEPDANALLKGDITIEPEEAADAQSRQRLIGKELRRWYDTIVKEPVPDELLDLLQQIDGRKKGS